MIWELVTLQTDSGRVGLVRVRRVASGPHEMWEVEVDGVRLTGDDRQSVLEMAQGYIR